MTRDPSRTSDSANPASAFVAAGSTTQAFGNRLPIKELTASVIAIVVAAVGLTMLWWLFRETTDPDQKEQLVNAGLTLVGTVMGYYFGRVPAERRAERAEKAVDEAQEGWGQAQAESALTRQAAADAGRKLDDVRATLAQTERSFESVDAMKGIADQAGGSAEAFVELRALRRRIQ
ncbi:MAG: hypothetical protein AAGE94_18580 [Acidobacteriota bacterium]